MVRKENTTTKDDKMAASVALVSGNHNNVREKCNDSGINISLQMDSNLPAANVESQSLIKMSGNFIEPSSLNMVSKFYCFIAVITGSFYVLFLLYYSIGF